MNSKRSIASLILTAALATPVAADPLARSTVCVFLAQKAELPTLNEWVLIRSAQITKNVEDQNPVNEVDKSFLRGYEMGYYWGVTTALYETSSKNPVSEYYNSNCDKLLEDLR